MTRTLLSSPRVWLQLDDRPRLRDATRDDYRALLGHDPPEAWYGIVAEQGGTLVGLGGISRHRAWRDHLPARITRSNRPRVAP